MLHPIAKEILRSILGEYEGHVQADAPAGDHALFRIGKAKEAGLLGACSEEVRRSHRDSVSVKGVAASR